MAQRAKAQPTVTAPEASAASVEDAGTRPGDSPLLHGLGQATDAGASAHYDDPAYYAHTYKTRCGDVDYYTRLAVDSGGPVLEYGVGTGRIALPIARAGVDISGVDSSGPMLEALKAKLRTESPEVAARLRFRRGDMRKVNLGRRFTLIIAPFNGFLHLYSREDVEQFLSRVKRHLAPNGEFVLDYSIPRCSDLSLDPARWFGTPPLKHPSSKKVFKYAERFEYQPLRQLLLMTMRFTPKEGGEPLQVPLTHRQFFPQELEALLHYNGFKHQVWSGDFADLPPTEKSDTLVVRCRRTR